MHIAANSTTAPLGRQYSDLVPSKWGSKGLVAMDLRKKEKFNPPQVEVSGQSRQLEPGL